MTQEEFQKICLKKDLLLDDALLETLSSFSDSEVATQLLEKVKFFLGKKFLTLSVFKKNEAKVNEIIDKNFSEGKINKIELRKKLNISSDPPEFGVHENKVLKKNTPKNSFTPKVLLSPQTTPKKLEVKDFVLFFRNRYNTFKEILESNPSLENLTSINKLSNEKQKISVVGIVTEKKITKNNNLVLEIEDPTGKIKVIINSGKEDLLKEGEDIVLDSVLGFKGTGNNEVLFANEIIFPEANLTERKKSDKEEYALFIGDVHYGSKNFLEKSFLKFIDYLNGNVPDTPESKKIKYLFIVGDLITGVGNYPNQELDLKVPNLETQFANIAALLGKIRKDIQIIISPGNHDCVRLMEPQPLLDEAYAWPLYELENVTLTGNPSLINICEGENFNGFKVLTYHGFSFPYYANTVPKLISDKAMNQPEKIMKFLLKHRHLAPTHTSTQYFPSEKDNLIIREIPDIFVSGHTHKSGVTHFNNILLISVSSWEGFTSYQEKFGNKPDHCKVPMLNLNTRQIKILDFETEEEGIRLYQE